MRIALLDREGEGIYVIGEMHDNGRVSRVLAVERTEANYAFAKRLVAAYNACEKLSDKALQQLSENSTAGDLAERAVAWSLFMYVARPTALRILKKARDQIHKQGGVA